MDKKLMYKNCDEIRKFDRVKLVKWEKGFSRVSNPRPWTWYNFRKIAGTVVGKIFDADIMKEPVIVVAWDNGKHNCYSFYNIAPLTDKEKVSHPVKKSFNIERAKQYIASMERRQQMMKEHPELLMIEDLVKDLAGKRRKKLKIFGISL